MRIILFILLGLSVSAQAQKGKKNKASTTGWAYNSLEWGGFESEKKGSTQEEIVALANKLSTEFGGNLVFMGGGTFYMGEKETSRPVTVSSFYLDETEVCNRHYRNFINWMVKNQPDYPCHRLLPDTAAWQSGLPADKADLADKLSRDYFRLPAFDYHPVVGVSWEQANAYSQWRTDRVNEAILIHKKYLAPTPEGQLNSFNTSEYLQGLYDAPTDKKTLRDSSGKARQVRFEDGILLPNYRLPTEAEWEFAAHTEHQPEKHKSTFRTTVTAHARKHPLPDYYQQNQALLPQHVFANAEKTAILRGMAGGVSEWVRDVYRLVTSTSGRDIDNPFRRDTSKVSASTKSHLKNGENEGLYIRTSRFYDADGKECSWYDFLQKQAKPASPYQIIERDAEDNLRLKVLSESEYKKHIQKQNVPTDFQTNRVYKGANAQGKNIQSIAGRDQHEERSASSFIGFRCAMTSVGSPRRKR